MSTATNKRLIAPCGMNCGICMAYLRQKNRCLGCRSSDTGKAISVIRCRIRTCGVLGKVRPRFCYQCEAVPCARLKQLDKRYGTKYDMSMMENLRQIKEDGMEAFLAAQRAKYRCPRCGGVVCVHNGRCYACEPDNSRRRRMSRRPDVP